MKAIVTKRYGSVEVLELQTVSKPVIKANEVLVRVHAASVNPVDWKIRSGKLKLMTGLKPPKILGADYAGVVAEVGRQVSNYKIGDHVWGKVNSYKGGAYAEYLKVKEEELAIKPEKLSFEEAASIPNVGLTAYQSLVYEGRLKAGHHVMINGCSGGVGLAGLQIAKALGCEVTGVCSTRNVELEKTMGADHVIDYKKEDVLRHKEAYDIFFDAVASQSFFKARKALKPGGIYVTTVPSFQSEVLGPIVNMISAKKMKKIMVKSSHQDLVVLREIAENGGITPVIEKVYALEQVSDAHRRSESGRVVGKVILKVA